MSRIKFFARHLCLVLILLGSRHVNAQEPVRGSIIEDRAARKLVEAGDARLEADEASKAVEIWQSVIERYPTSRVRFEAHIRLGNHYLERERAYDKARVQFEEVASEENRDQEQRAEATLKMGMCFYEARNFGKCFSVMRDVIEHFPVSRQVNQAYYYIGLGHFQLGHYSRAIDALEKVGTSMGEDDSQLEKVEAGKRLFVKIEDADLAAIETGASVIVQCETSGGDIEQVKCFPVGRNVRIVLGSVVTVLGVPQKNNGRLEVKGDDTVKVVYVDEHTADKQFNRQVIHTARIVGDGVVSITDGAFAETLQGVVLGKAVNIQTKFPVGNLRSSNSNAAEITLDTPGFALDEQQTFTRVSLVTIGDSNQVARHCLQNGVSRNGLFSTNERNRRTKNPRVDRCICLLGSCRRFLIALSSGCDFSLQRSCVRSFGRISHGDITGRSNLVGWTNCLDDSL